MALQTVTEDIDLPGGANPAAFTVEIRLVGGGGSPISGFHAGTDTTIVGALDASMDANGVITTELQPNSEITPGGTMYRRLLKGPGGTRDEAYFIVPNSGEPHDLQEILGVAPTVVPTSELQSHANKRTQESGGVHGVVRHRWDVDGWAPFSHHVVNVDGAQVFTRTVESRRGRFTGSVGGTATAAGPGNHREVSVRSDTNWADSEIRSLWFGPSVFSIANQVPTRRPQMGHVHRYQLNADGKQRALVAWFNIFGGPNPEAIVLNLWEFEGTTLLQGNGGAGGSLTNVDRSGLIGYSQRIDGFNATQHRVAPPLINLLIPNGASVSVTGMTDTSFNDPAAVTIASGSRTGGLVTINTSTPHGLTTGDWALVDGTDNGYDGIWQVTVTDSDTFTYLQQHTDDAAVGGGTVIKRWTVNGSQPANSLVSLLDLIANNNIDKTAGGFISPDYPWKVFPYWVVSRCVGNTLTVKQWAYGAQEPDWGDPKVVSVSITSGAPSASTGMPVGEGLCGIVCAHAHDNDYGEFGDIEFRRL